MTRISKPPEERRAEFVETAARLFDEIGYAACSVERIIREIGVAKGTFYYHFTSKPEVLAAVVEQTLDAIVETARHVADLPGIPAMEKMRMLLGGLADDESRALAERMHRPENRELHELTNVRTVLRLSPVIADVVRQGVAEEVFAVDRPLETVQLLLTGAQFLADEGLFEATPEELAARRRAIATTIERALGAAPGSFAFMTGETDP